MKSNYDSHRQYKYDDSKGTQYERTYEQTKEQNSDPRNSIRKETIDSEEKRRQMNKRFKDDFPWQPQHLQDDLLDLSDAYNISKERIFDMFLHYNETFEHLRRFLIEKYGEEPLDSLKQRNSANGQYRSTKSNNSNYIKEKEKPRQSQNNQQYNPSKPDKSKIGSQSTQQRGKNYESNNAKSTKSSETPISAPKFASKEEVYYEKIPSSEVKPTLIDPKYSLTTAELKKLEAQSEIKGGTKSDKKQEESGKKGEDIYLTTAKQFVQKELVFQRFGVFVASVQNPDLAESEAKEQAEPAICLVLSMEDYAKLRKNKEVSGLLK